MKAKMTLVIELLEPALIRETADLIELDSAQVRQVSLRLNSTESEVQGIETKADPETTNLAELIEFARTVQSEPTTVELWFHGRSESFDL